MSDKIRTGPEDRNKVRV